MDNTPARKRAHVNFEIIWAESVSLRGRQNEQKQRENVCFHAINRPFSAWWAVPCKLPVFCN